MDAIRNKVYEGFGYILSSWLPVAKRHKAATQPTVVALEIEQENDLTQTQTAAKPTPKTGRKKVKVKRLITPSLVEYSAFLGRLNIALTQTQNVSSEFSKLISKQDLRAIYIYCVEEFENKKAQEIKGLKAGESIRLAKENTGLPRTLNLLRTHLGEYQLILETKRKLKDGTKQKLEEAAGSFKKGKPAWRIDTPVLIEYFNAVAKIKKLSGLSGLKEEVKIAQLFGGQPGINLTYLGQAFSKVVASCIEDKVSVYSERAISDLYGFLYKKKSRLTDVQKNKMISELLQALKLFHDQGLVHQDLKPANILVYETSPGVYSLKLTDFGLTRKHGEMNQQSVATNGYQSPEIEHYHSMRHTDYHSYFKVQNVASSAIGKELYKIMNFSGINPENFKAPDKANDIWAMAIVIYEIMHGVAPTRNDWKPVIKQDLLLAQMLRCNRENRCDIDRAIELHQENQQQKNAKTRGSMTP